MGELNFKSVIEIVRDEFQRVVNRSIIEKFYAMSDHSLRVLNYHYSYFWKNLASKIIYLYYITVSKVSFLKNFKYRPEINLEIR